MTKQQFNQLMDKHLNGSATPEEEKQLVNWYDLLQHKGPDEQLLEPEGIDAVLEMIQSRIQTPHSSNRTTFIWIGIAASFFIIQFFVYSCLIIFKTDKSNIGPNRLTERSKSVINLSLERRVKEQ